MSAHMGVASVGHTVILQSWKQQRCREQFNRLLSSCDGLHFSQSDSYVSVCTGVAPGVQGGTAAG